MNYMIAAHGNQYTRIHGLSHTHKHMQDTRAHMSRSRNENASGFVVARRRESVQIASQIAEAKHTIYSFCAFEKLIYHIWRGFCAVCACVSVCAFGTDNNLFILLQRRQ